MNRSKGGIAGVIAAALMILFFIAIMYAYLNFAVQNSYTSVVSSFGTGIWNPIADLNFALQIWQFWLLIVLFAVAVFVWQSAQKRQPGVDV